MRFLTLLLVSSGALAQQLVPRTLPEVHRVFVANLTGGAAADSLREMMIASLNQTGLFTLTDDPNTADAILKGAADDRTFVQSFDSDKAASGHEDGGVGSGTRSKSGGYYSGVSGADRESYHIRDRKHEAYASVRLVNRAGDTLWSTTQESQGAKFRSASTDVASKVARQIALDLQAAARHN